MGHDEIPEAGLPHEEGDLDRAAILARRRHFIVIALSGLTAGTGCSACLKIATPTTTATAGPLTTGPSTGSTDTSSTASTGNATGTATTTGEMTGGTTSTMTTGDTTGSTTGTTATTTGEMTGETPTTDVGAQEP